MLDLTTQFPDMLRRAEAEVRKFFPVTSKTGRQLRAENFRWINIGDAVRDDFAAQKKTKLRDGTLAAKLVADVSLVDDKHKVLDSRTGMIVLQVPHATAAGTFIVDGKELQVVNQLRLRPGLYTRFTVSDDVETFVNTSAAGTYRVILERNKGKFYFRVGPSAHFPLTTVLRALGISDGEMVQSWGKPIYEATQERTSDDEMALKLLMKLRPNLKPAPASAQEARQMLGDFLRSKPLDPEVNNLTLGQPFERIDGRALLAASVKCLKLAKREVEADDPESLSFKSIHSVEDFISERLAKQIPGLQRAVAFKLDRAEKVTDVFHSGMMTEPVRLFFAASEFSRYADQNNPVEMANLSHLTTVMGEGGIGSTHAVRDEVRAVHPSHLGVLDPVRTPEGQAVGLTGSLALGAQKVGNRIMVPVADVRTGKRFSVTVEELERSVVAFPDQYDLTKTPPKPMHPRVKGRLRQVFREFAPSEVQFILPDVKLLLGPSTNIIPFLHSDDGNRAGMGDRHVEQTVPLLNPDKPLVQAKFGDRGYEELFGSQYLPTAPVDGVVTKIEKDFITIKGARKSVDVQLHHYYPLNSSTYIHDTPSVKVGDKVKVGDRLADNNFTRGGSLAMGANLRVAYVPWKGENFEDGVIISQSAAQKLTSVHKYDLRLDLDKTIKTGLGRLLAQFPDQSKLVQNRNAFDETGVIKVGSTLNPNDLVVAAVREADYHADYDYARLHKSLSKRWSDVSIYWDGHTAAKVVDVIKTPTFTRVIVTTEEPAQIGDKVSMRHGGKGIITSIMPDGEILHDAEGRPMDVLFNPAGLVGRVNPGQLLEAAAGKVSAKTGKTYLVENFSRDNKDAVGDVRRDLRMAGLDENSEESLTDPLTGRTYDRTMAGTMHFLKLRHSVSKKYTARGFGEQYTVDQAPAKTEEGSAQRIGGLELYALLAGDAKHYVNDAFTIKGQRNDEYWRAVQMGLPPPRPKTPFISEKFLTYMAGAGVDLKRDGDIIKASPMTDKTILAASNGAIQNALVIDAGTLKPEKGGLFDQELTGGPGGDHYNHIELPEPIVHPLMMPAAAAVAGISNKQLSGLIDGSYGYDAKGEVVVNDGKMPTGVPALAEHLSKIDVDKELKSLEVKINATQSLTLRDKLLKRRRYLLALQQLGMKPNEAYINNVIPVIPAKFRAVYPLPDGSLNVADPVHGYREVMLVAEALKDLKALKVSDDKLGQVRTDLHAAIGGLVGTTEPLTRSAHFKGFLQQIKGLENKTGMFQGKVMTRPQDLSARSTIIPDPKLNLDDVGIPEDMALVIYRPFLIRRLKALGHQPLAARDMVEKKHPLALKALELEVKERPVLLNRAPSLHKFNVMAFRPRIVQGQAVMINPLIVKGYNADFDGDTMGIHVPVTEDARKEALEKLLPSKNMLSPADNRVVHTPSNEMLLGIYLMTNPIGAPKPAKSELDIVAAYKAKKVQANTAFRIKNEVTCPGRVLFNEILPEPLRIHEPVTSKLLSKIIDAVAKQYEPQAPGILSKLKDMGNHYVTEIGFSVSLRDLVIDKTQRDVIMSDARARTKDVGFAQASMEAVKKLDTFVHSPQNHGNRMVQLTSISGALGSKSAQVTRMLGAPVAVMDHHGVPVPVQINKSYAEGFDLGSYWATMPGVRKGMMDKGLSTADTGYLTKLLVQANIENVISEADCGATDGVLMQADDSDLIGRYIANGKDAGHPVTPEMQRRLQTAGASILVRSALKCRSSRGVCQKCFGNSENGKPYPVGYHLGVLAAQTVGEPSTQLSLRTFHSGGSIGGRSAAGFPRVKQLYHLPENVTGRSILALEAGVVGPITAAPAGGWMVTIGARSHYVPQELGLKVKVGQRVAAGDQISLHGVLRPQDLLDATGDVDRTRAAMINDLSDSFKGSGVNIKRRIFETTVKPMTDKAEVSDPGDGYILGVVAGDVLPIVKLEAMNQKLINKIKFTPLLLGVVQVPHRGGDFIGRLMHERIVDTVRNAASRGQTSDIGPNGHPVASLALRNVQTPIGMPDRRKR